MLEPIFDPAHGDAELPRREAHEHDVGEDGRLDPERAARVGRRDQPELRARQPERSGRDGVQRERALEVRPGGERALGLRSSRRRRRSTRPACSSSAGSGSARGRRDRPARALRRRRRMERAVGDARVGVDRGLCVEHRLERLVLDLDQLEGVLGEVAVARDDDRDRLADVARRSRARPRTAGRRVDAGRKRPRELDDVGTGEDADDAGELERSASGRAA